MRSPSIEGRARTLVGRVATVAALAAVFGGMLAAIAAVVLAETAVERAEDRRLRDEAVEIATELRGLPENAMAAALEAERQELAAAGLRLAVFRERTLLGGDARLALRSDGCATERASGARDQRICAASSGPISCVVAVDEAPSLGAWAMAGIVSIAAVIAALMGILFSRGLARWAMGPLARLEGRLGDAPMDEAVDLGEDEGVREIDALRRTLRALLDRRAEALRSARVFAAGAAHELRTPLTMLSGELELLAEEDLPSAVQSRIDGLRTNVARIAQLVERLLVFARASAAEAMRHDAVEVGELMEAFRARLPADDAARITYVERASGLVRGDESLLAVLCENVLRNALVHARPSAVRVEVDERDGEVLLDVMDEGPGVPTNERARLFEPFQRGATGGPGRGLGLALVSQIARAHGGEVAFLNVERGAHIRVRLPGWTAR